MDITDIKPGTQLTWHYTPRGGYGYTFSIRVKVLSVSTKPVRVEAQLAGATEIKPVSLSPRHCQLNPELRGVDVPKHSPSGSRTVAS